MSLVLPPQHLTESARADWHALQAETPHPRRFDPADADRLPEPARGWVLHAIAPGTPLRRTAVLSSHGRIRLGAWRSYTAQQVLAPPAGYVWAASTFPVRGFDRYRDGAGEMRWRMLDLFRVASESGPDVSRSAADRLACESVLTPAFALDPAVVWKALDDRTALARVGEREVTLAIAPDGALREVRMRRWGNPDGGPYGLHDFAVVCEEEDEFDGFTVPVEMRGAWDGQDFITISVDGAVFR